MVGANMAVNWVNADMSTTTSHRGASAQVQPLETLVQTTEGFSVNMGVSMSRPGMSVWSWNFPQPEAPTSAMDHVYSVASSSPASSASDATIYKHYSHDLGITLDMTKAYTGAAPAGLAGAPTPATTTSSSTGLRNLGNPITRIYLVHMVRV